LLRIDFNSSRFCLLELKTVKRILLNWTSGYLESSTHTLNSFTSYQIVREFMFSRTRSTDPAFNGWALFLTLLTSFTVVAELPLPSITRQCLMISS